MRNSYFSRNFKGNSNILHKLETTTTWTFYKGSLRLPDGGPDTKGSWIIFGVKKQRLKEGRGTGVYLWEQLFVVWVVDRAHLHRGNIQQRALSQASLRYMQHVSHPLVRTIPRWLIWGTMRVRIQRRSNGPHRWPSETIIHSNAFTLPIVSKVFYVKSYRKKCVSYLFFFYFRIWIWIWKIYIFRLSLFT